MTPGEIDRIAAAANALRPDWPIRSLQTLLARPELAHRPRRDVAVALTWVACESATLNPGRVIEAGPWWKAAVAGDDTVSGHRPPRRDQECPRHPGQYADRCGGCAADQATHTPAPPQQHHVNPDAERAHRGAAAARAALRAATTVQEDS